MGKGKESRTIGGASFRSAVLMSTVLGVGGGLAAWKVAAAEDAEAAAAAAPEPIETVTAAVATMREYVATTTSIGTVLATRSVTLRNELPGTVHQVAMTPGAVVEEGALLVALDVSVEEAELRALEARGELARTTLARYERMVERQAASAIELDQARAERDIALAEIARLRAIIERKTIRAPFRARVGISDVHRGQFLETGTLLTTLQGVANAVNVDFAVTESVAAGLAPGAEVQVQYTQSDAERYVARVTAIDARVDPATRNAMVRARIEGVGSSLAPGASVRVQVPAGPPTQVVIVPASALRRGPAGDHVFVLVEADGGVVRASLRQVQAGPALGNEVVILGGLEAGDRLAASGSFKLREGARLNVVEGGS